MNIIRGEDNLAKLKDYILNPDISIHDPLPDVLPRKFNEMRLLHIPKCAGSTKLIPRRDILTGEILEFVEIEVEDVGANAFNSMSMHREPGLLEEVTRGSHLNYPFWPGGFEERSEVASTLELAQIEVELDLEQLLTVPPGFTAGHDFAEEKQRKPAENPVATTNVDLLDNLEQQLDVQQWLELTRSQSETATTTNVADSQKDLKFPADVDEQLLEVDLQPILNISSTQQSFSSDWAEMVDMSQPIDNFKAQIPAPALEFPFELDVFQKQAILKLEQRQYVFVAAHTSAGKTVVAEYAIAMSKRDLTRTIYTSPIKALSNQKYRDFRKTFKDVGLITGDLQIEPTASCLIMTTEILRSMLYCGSDITRDLEYVIFDEVHYINNPERGHVWEEIIILLPDHVNIIMLSATVPNTMELADWVGSTKKRKVYVISTLKRPVPLMHYLYTGAGGKSRDDIFLLVDAQGKYLQGNYERAVERKKEMSSSKTGGGSSNYINSKQEQYIWTGLIDFLKRHNKMPVVAFTLSRNRCDANVLALKSVDLNTAKEKGAVQKFFLQCLAKLKPPDRTIPQVLALKDSLERGIGVHHSGILPILKEIVEMLFQNGLVKLLFATETFAMGVNMPARTVIFDSIKKFDGLEMRNLKPGEYIQMAGRAGRRGHDENGTVILMCKTGVPPSMELRPMILGLPEKLQSQFILRYAVILTCLRIESIKVEDIMQYSFKEFKQKLQLPTQQKLLRVAEDKFAMLPTLGEHLQPLIYFYDKSVEYWKEKHRIMKFIVTQAKIQKELKVGRIIIITHGTHYNKLAILLNVKSVLGKDTIYKVLVLDHQFKSKNQGDTINRGELYYKILSLTPQHRFFHPEGIGGHTVLDIKAIDIVNITKSTIKVDADVIIRNWEQRQLERFKDAPPGATVVKVVTELQQLNEAFNANPDSIKYINMSKEINVNADDEMAMLNYVDHLKRQVGDVLPHTNIAGFEQEFDKVYERRVLEINIEELRFKNSAKNLTLYPDYCNKLQVLRSLNYIDELNEVTLKGKVACEMGQNELMITELIFCNMFNDLGPAEIAALLSGLVFQAKIKGQPVIPPTLKECVAAFEQINDNILAEEQRCQAGIQAENNLNFGLLEVVYEWAKNKPFAEIMKLTEVQEGIIVRCIQQLDETLRDVKTAAIRIGNPGLQSKMEEASEAIKRDIVFTASLYTEL
ncbi:helicase SKI2W [Drosophila innubila]|uniref:helicase SKI2W n=1 Tax=Drosophila innubila TaxID=198719 RepID=UPI00148D5BC6|nr:helicase SKI2W [Drosophila innubila]